MIYEKPEIFYCTKDQMLEFFANSEKCTVVCTYMFAYCGDEEGWGTTYCPNWAQGGK